jgi:hypothetical protein
MTIASNVWSRTTDGPLRVPPSSSLDSFRAGDTCIRWIACCGRDYLVFQPEVAESADAFPVRRCPGLDGRKATTTTHARDGVTRFVRVGVHVRRGDVTTAAKIAYGYTTPNETYYMRALLYFVERYRSSAVHRVWK